MLDTKDHHPHDKGYVCDFQYILINVCKLERGEIKKEKVEELRDELIESGQLKKKTEREDVK